jgi:hypothetical protein
MSKPVSQPRLSLRSGALLFSLVASIGACATLDTPRRGFAEASAVQPSQPTSWGFATAAEPTQPARQGYARVAGPPQSTSWGFASIPAERTLAAQASR